MYLAHLHPKANVCAKFHENWSTEEIVCDARFTPIFPTICRYYGNALSATVQKCVLHIYTPGQTSVSKCVIKHDIFFVSWMFTFAVNVGNNCTFVLAFLCLLAKCYTFTGDRFWAIFTFAGEVLLHLLAFYVSWCYSPPPQRIYAPVWFWYFSDSFQT